MPLRDAYVDFDMRQAMAAGTVLRSTADRMHAKFGGGLAYPYQVLLVPTDPFEQILSEEFFEHSGDLLREVNHGLKDHLPEVYSGTSFNFLSYRTDVGRVPFDQLAELCQLPGIGDEEDADPEEAAIFEPLCSYFFNSFTNSQDFRKEVPTAAYGMIFAGIDPIGQMGNDFLDYIREATERLGPKYGLQVAISGTAPKAVDMIQCLYKAMIPAVIGTFVMASLFMGISFRSVLTPVRAVVNSLLTLGLTYGLIVLVFQDGILNPLRLPEFSNQFHAIPWFPPVVLFFVITGFGLDYDIFLLVRVTELRGRGYEPRKAIQKGLVSTAGIITAAGFVMIIAFSGMCMSALQQENVFGLAMVIAVSYDTFIARSIVSPAVMSLLGYANWWPSALYQLEVSTLDGEHSGFSSAKSSPNGTARQGRKKNNEDDDSRTTSENACAALLVSEPDKESLQRERSPKLSDLV
mmetsp:Transcript_132551/g.243338  ORF Transcript_132551/g.243338 Transcript_132551/m.243338 type:complete len:463 (-) Transcript_132551:29-1417(-)